MKSIFIISFPNKNNIISEKNHKTDIQADIAKTTETLSQKITNLVIRRFLRNFEI